MRVFDATKATELKDYDLSKGCLKQDTLTIHHDAVKAVAEKSHYEVVRTYPNGGKDVRKVVDVAGVEARPAWDETEDIQVYIPYTAEELARMQKQEEARANSRKTKLPNSKPQWSSLAASSQA